MGLIKRAVEDTARGYLATLTATKASAGSVKETLTGKDSPACVGVMSPEARDRLAQAIAEPIPAAQRGKNIRGLADIKSYSPGPSGNSGYALFNALYTRRDGRTFTSTPEHEGC